MPTPKQMEKLDSTGGMRLARALPTGPGDEMPDEYWEAVLKDPRAGARLAGSSGRVLRLSEIPQHLLRVGCSRCARTVEIQKADAVRLYGRQTAWKDCAQRLLDDTCQVRTGRHEEDGCWPVFE
jgi:hypothetical protein